MTVSREQLDSLRDSLRRVVDEPQEQSLNEADDKSSDGEDKSGKDDSGSGEGENKPAPKKPDELNTLQEVYDQLKKLGQKGETLGPNETERHEKALEYLGGLLERLEQLLGEREQEAETDDDESSG